MDSLFRDLDFVSCYSDDIIIFSKRAEEHFQHLEIALQRLQQHQPIAREAKCSFYQTEIQFLGFRFAAEGRAVDATKTAAITSLAPPTTVHGRQRWFGMVNYYRSFIPRFAHITAPLSDLLKGHPQRGRPAPAVRQSWTGVRNTKRHSRLSGCAQRWQNPRSCVYLTQSYPLGSRRMPPLSP